MIFLIVIIFWGENSSFIPFSELTSTIVSWCTCDLTRWPIKDAQQVITFASKCGTINCRCIKDFDWSYQSTNQRIAFLLAGSSFGVWIKIFVHTVVHYRKSSSVLAHQDGRVVKALDLSSNGGIPAWVRTSLLVIFFIFFILPAAHQWFHPIRDQNRHREGKMLKMN